MRIILQSACLASLSPSVNLQALTGACCDQLCPHRVPMPVSKTPLPITMALLLQVRESAWSLSLLVTDNSLASWLGFWSLV